MSLPTIPQACKDLVKCNCTKGCSTNSFPSKITSTVIMMTEKALVKIDRTRVQNKGSGGSVCRITVTQYCYIWFNTGTIPGHCPLETYSAPSLYLNLPDARTTCPAPTSHFGHVSARGRSECAGSPGHGACMREKTNSVNALCKRIRFELNLTISSLVHV